MNESENHGSAVLGVWNSRKQALQGGGWSLRGRNEHRNRKCPAFRNRIDLQEVVTLPADHRGASLIIPYREGFLWAISTTDLWRRIRGKQYVYYEGVGGGLEPGESFEEAALRECREETACEVELLKTTKTFVLDEFQHRTRQLSARGIGPFMIWRKRLFGRRLLTAYTYVARIHGEPKPQAEVPALLFASAKELSRRNTPKVVEVVQSGSKIMEKELIPPAAFLRPWGTPTFLRELTERKLVNLEDLLAEAK